MENRNSHNVVYVRVVSLVLLVRITPLVLKTLVRVTPLVLKTLVRVTPLLCIINGRQK